ncbi:GNAT family N-acetyltransferase [Lysobacter sp. TY2-98]|uniref:GNAT family N-acetyltransferase n=1 Tax=Lysobacter sp. TY2-98 TaxID=2290922 RepID=UPI000E20B23E|nr:GNAT family N-acetyltransferase [Lysobacter sp. TY2-98]AXK72610.1 GNAT family N-acetyltransferase [Lysobacter sp. TY2-98]
MGIAIRAATQDDHDAILALVPRLAATGTPALRDAKQVCAADLASVGEALRASDGRCACFIAEIDGGLAGFIHVRRVQDYYTQREIAHVSDVVVAPHAEGRGVGRALMTAAEAWAKAQGHPLIQLYVLPENAPARALYERSGYTPEWMKYIKPLD